MIRNSTRIILFLKHTSSYRLIFKRLLCSYTYSTRLILEAIINSQDMLPPVTKLMKEFWSFISCEMAHGIFLLYVESQANFVSLILSRLQTLLWVMWNAIQVRSCVACKKVLWNMGRWLSAESITNWHGVSEEDQVRSQSECPHDRMRKVMDGGTQTNGGYLLRQLIPRKYLV
jgi:hypothetical protein